jgi:transcriptional regulator with XRE-family HTH domain
VAPASQPASGVVDVRELGELLRARRTASGLTLRQLQAELENVLTASALSRIENGAVPEARNVQPIARWLRIPMSQIAWPGQMTSAQVAQSTPDAVEVHLRADKNLKPEAADALARMFRLLYDDIVHGRIKPGKPDSR